MSNILFYVSGHGYGHSVRIAEVIHALRTIEPDAKITVRTTAPARLFGGDVDEALKVQRANLDPTVVEQGIFKIDWNGSAGKLAEFLSHRDRIIEVETAWVREHGIERIVADIPFLAGEIAYAADIPCIGISNFLWDWIYEPMLKGYEGGDAFLQIVSDGYGRFHSVLRLPFAHAMTVIRRVVDVPLVATISRRSRRDILKAIGIKDGDHGQVVLVSLRDGCDPATLSALASRQPDILFLNIGDVPESGPLNLHQVIIGKEVTFADVTSIADLIVGKPGYGMIAACAANRKRLLYVPRVGFREDEALLRGAAGCITIEPLPLREFEAGAWDERLHAMLKRPVLEHGISVEGARVCAEFIAGLI